MSPSTIKKEDEVAWNKFQEVLKQKHLEAALHEVQLSPQVTKLIIEKTLGVHIFSG